MPVDRKRYPTGWNAFSRYIRLNRAASSCECTGQCGKHHQRRCTEQHHAPAVYARGRIVLTCAHLCPCDPPCMIDAHVIAACQACHLRIDVALHLRHRREKRAAAQRDKSLGLWPWTPSPDPKPAADRTPPDSTSLTLSTHPNGVAQGAAVPTPNSSQEGGF